MCLSQEELMRDLAGSKGTKVKDGRSLPPSTYMGHFMKPYFKDKVTGVVSGPGPALVGKALCTVGRALVPKSCCGES